MSHRDAFVVFMDTAPLLPLLFLMFGPEHSGTLISSRSPINLDDLSIEKILFVGIYGGPLSSPHATTRPGPSQSPFEGEHSIHLKIWYALDS